MAALGSDRLQGFGIGMPMPAAEMLTWARGRIAVGPRRRRLRRRHLVAGSARTLLADGSKVDASLAHLSRATPISWRALWTLNPALLGGCRPLDFGGLIDADDWAVTAHFPVTDWSSAPTSWSRAGAEHGAAPAPCRAVRAVESAGPRPDQGERHAARRVPQARSRAGRLDRRLPRADRRAPGDEPRAAGRGGGAAARRAAAAGRRPRGHRRRPRPHRHAGDHALEPPRLPRLLPQQQRPLVGARRPRRRPGSACRA